MCTRTHSSPAPANVLCHAGRPPLLRVTHERLASAPTPRSLVDRSSRCRAVCHTSDSRRVGRNAKGVHAQYRIFGSPERPLFGIYGGTTITTLKRVDRVQLSACALSFALRPQPSTHWATTGTAPESGPPPCRSCPHGSDVRPSPPQRAYCRQRRLREQGSSWRTNTVVAGGVGLRWLDRRDRAQQPAPSATRTSDLRSQDIPACPHATNPGR